ncbi:MAG: GyrI-like domain-containing protein [Flavobacteriaceae bacterium]
MKKINLKKELSDYFNPSKTKVALVDVPAMNFLMIDGKGDPNTSKAYAEAIEALFSVSYALKFMIKKGAMAIDYGVMPLEGLWWVEDMQKFDPAKKEDWQWTAMIMQPEFITSDLVAEAKEQVRTKKDPKALSKLQFEAFTEGKAAQIMHIGPFSEEGPTIKKVHDFIASNGFLRSGKHHEIYLSDIRRAAPEKWKTIVRQPYRDRLE